ncbi:MAG TPA: pantoate--beta-alanine ligase [Gammaproteobacteria bacterium]|nr:pantoate--beta-alanine ligase [Gammaproteobacteria bacterium]
METVTELDVLRRLITDWRKQNVRIGFVPTMGNLHDGHLALVARARALCERVVASVFVNPLQFGAGEDYAAYPRTPGDDERALRGAGTDLLFLPAVDVMYPNGASAATRIEVPGLSAELEGAARPGHFAGVATVVGKLFNMVQPDVAVFGEKDFQQLLVVRRMVADLCWPVEVVGVPTVREPDGLALSSRNRYLSAAERERAPLLHRVLQSTASRLRAGSRDFGALEADAEAALARGGVSPEYVSVRRAADLSPPSADALDPLVVLAAARLGRARLIDNVSISIG